ncbi:MAG: LytTR family transcriptional regulator DNA-binding domain-containing protein [Lachnospiraceae bacterium]
MEPDNILYIYRNSGKTVICSKSGEIASSTVRMQDLLEFLPEGEFLSISRKAIVRRVLVKHLILITQSVPFSPQRQSRSCGCAPPECRGR